MTAWLGQSLCLMTDSKLLLAPSPAPAPGWEQITGNNSSFPELLLLGLAAPPRSEAQLQRPQDNRLGCGFSSVKRGKSQHALTKSPGAEGLFGDCLTCVAEMSLVTSTGGIKRQAQGNQWNYFLCVTFCVPRVLCGSQLPHCGRRDQGSCFMGTQGSAAAMCGSAGI